MATFFTIIFFFLFGFFSAALLAAGKDEYPERNEKDT